MENMDLKTENETLKNEIEMLKYNNTELEERLKKYTNGKGHHKYYEKNKEIIKQNGSINLTKLKTENPDKLKEYRRRAYLKRKEKLQTKNTETDENI
jgi:hypothetical protein